MDDSDQPKPMSRWERVRAFGRRNWWWVPIGALACICVAAYVFQFAPAAHWEFSRNTEDWARFGEYMGGVFGVCAFIGVLITLHLQRKQLNQAANQDTIDELMQLCRLLVKNVDDLLDGLLPNVVDLPERAFVRWAQTSEDMRGLIKAAANPLLREDLTHKITDSGGDPKVHQALQRIASEMDQLARCVEVMYIWGGSAIILNFYRERYRDAAQTMVRFDVLLETAPFWLQASEKVHPL